MFKIIYSIFAIFFSFIALIFAFFYTLIKTLIDLFLGKQTTIKKSIKTPVKQTFKHKQKTYEYDKENDIWHLTEEDKRIAKEERMSYADYIEAEEHDDDNLDNDD